MAVEEPNIVNAEPPVVDSGIPVADPDTTPASGWQITLAAILVVAILSVFFYGVSNQRLEVAGSTPPSPQATNMPPAKAPSTAAAKQASTTGQAPHDEAPNAANPPGKPHQQQPQKASGQNAAQPASAPQKNQ